MVDRVDPSFFVIPGKSDAVEYEIHIYTFSVGKMYLHRQYGFGAMSSEAIRF